MSLLSYITGYDEENAARAAEADRQLREMNRTRYGVDYVNQDDYLSPEDSRAAISESFDEGWRDGRQNVSNFVASAFNILGDVLKAVILGIPFWVWLIVLGFFFYQMGGFTWLKMKAAAK